MQLLQVSTVERAPIVVRDFTQQQPELSLTDVSAATRLRLLATLSRHGTTMKDPRTRLYRLSFAVIALAEVRFASSFCGGQ
jgi:DNA-binding IclR family transcriptional regulator